MVTGMADLKILWVPVSKYSFREPEAQQMPSVHDRHIHGEVFLYFLFRSPVEFLIDGQFFSFDNLFVFESTDDRLGYFDGVCQVISAAGYFGGKFIWRNPFFCKFYLDFRKHKDIQRILSDNFRESWVLFLLLHFQHLSLNLQLMPGRLVFQLQVRFFIKDNTVLNELHLDRVVSFQQSEIETHFILSMRIVVSKFHEVIFYEQAPLAENLFYKQLIEGFGINWIESFYLILHEEILHLIRIFDWLDDFPSMRSILFLILLVD